MPRICYLQPKDLVRHSRHHTAYAGDGAVHVPGGPPPQQFKLEFFNGIARDVPENIYQRFKDLGIADVNKPSFDDDEEES